LDLERDVVTAMDADARSARIQRLQAEVEAHCADIAAREDARAQNPILMHDYLRSEREAAPAPQPQPPLQREASSADLVFKTTENALAPVQTPVTMDAKTQEPWDAWLLAHLRNERTDLLDGLEKGLCEMMDAVRADREAGDAAVRRELTELRRELAASEERRAAVAEVRKQFAGVERERLESTLALRDARIAALEQRMDTLMRFMSLQGYEPPKGV
jgi:hypothetical protein